MLAPVSTRQRSFPVLLVAKELIAGAAVVVGGGGGNGTTSSNNNATAASSSTSVDLRLCAEHGCELVQQVAPTRDEAERLLDAAIAAMLAPPPAAAVGGGRRRRRSILGAAKSTEESIGSTESIGSSSSTAPSSISSNATGLVDQSFARVGERALQLQVATDRDGWLALGLIVGGGGRSPAGSPRKVMRARVLVDTTPAVVRVRVRRDLGYEGASGVYIVASTKVVRARSAVQQGSSSGLLVPATSPSPAPDAPAAADANSSSSSSSVPASLNGGGGNSSTSSSLDAASPSSSTPLPPQARAVIPLLPLGAPPVVHLCEVDVVASEALSAGLDAAVRSTFNATAPNCTFVGLSATVLANGTHVYTYQLRRTIYPGEALGPATVRWPRETFADRVGNVPVGSPIDRSISTSTSTSTDRSIGSIDPTATAVDIDRSNPTASPSIDLDLPSPPSPVFVSTTVLALDRVADRIASAAAATTQAALGAAVATSAATSVGAAVAAATASSTAAAVAPTAAGASFAQAFVAKSNLLRAGHHVQLLAMTGSLAVPGLSEGYKALVSSFGWSLLKLSPNKNKNDSGSRSTTTNKSIDSVDNRSTIAAAQPIGGSSHRRRALLQQQSTSSSSDPDVAGWLQTVESSGLFGSFGGDDAQSQQASIDLDSTVPPPLSSPNTPNTNGQGFLLTLGIAGIFLAGTLLLHGLAIGVWLRFFSRRRDNATTAPPPTMPDLLIFPCAEVLLGGLLLTAVVYFAGLEMAAAARGARWSAALAWLVLVPLPFSALLLALAVARVRGDSDGRDGDAIKKKTQQEQFPPGPHWQRFRGPLMLAPPPPAAVTATVVAAAAAAAADDADPTAPPPPRPPPPRLRVDEQQQPPPSPPPPASPSPDTTTATRPFADGLVSFYPASEDDNSDNGRPASSLPPPSSLGSPASSTAVGGRPRPVFGIRRRADAATATTSSSAPPTLLTRLHRYSRRLEAMWTDITDVATLDRSGGSTRRSLLVLDARLAFFGANVANKALAALLLAAFSSAKASTLQVALLFSSHAAMLLYLGLARPFTDAAMTAVELLATALELVVFACAALLLRDPARYAPANMVASAAFVAAVALLLLFELKRVLTMALTGARVVVEWVRARRRQRRKGGDGGVVAAVPGVAAPPRPAVPVSDKKER
jgi:hypothetical protein